MGVHFFVGTLHKNAALRSVFWAGFFKRYTPKESYAMHFARILTISILLLFSLAHAKGYEHAQSTELSAALEKMQHQKPEKFNFVLVNLDGTNNYFQYAIDGQGTFYFDVPKMSLSAEQYLRAKRFFSSQNVNIIRVIDQKGYTGEPIELESFQKIFQNKNIEGGVSLGIGFMTEVIGHEAGITIIKGWE